MMTHLEFSEGGSSKFWRIVVDGNSHTVTFGRIGTDGQAKTKTFGSPDEARAAAEKLIAEKRKKGYVDVGASTAQPARDVGVVGAPTAQPARDSDGTRRWLVVRGRKYTEDGADDAKKLHAALETKSADERAKLIADALVTSDSRLVLVECRKAAEGLLEAGEIGPFLKILVAAARVLPDPLFEIKVGFWLLRESSPARTAFLEALTAELATTELPAIARLGRDLCDWLFNDEEFIHEMASRATAGGGGYKKLATTMLRERKKLTAAASSLRAVTDHELFAKFARFPGSSWEEALENSEAAVREFSFEPRYVKTAIWCAWALLKNARVVEVYERFGEGLLAFYDDGSLKYEDTLAHIVYSYSAAGRNAERLEPILAKVAWAEVKSPLLLGMMAYVHAKRGELAASTRYLELMLRRRDPEYGWAWVEAEPTFAELRASPKGAALAKGVP